MNDLIVLFDVVYKLVKSINVCVCLFVAAIVEQLFQLANASSGQAAAI